MNALALLADHDRTPPHVNGTADILPTRQRKPSLRRVSFEFYAPAARELFLAGEFNDWDATSMPLHFSADGHWWIEVMLPAGIYRYKFVIDSVWRCSAEQLHDRCDRPCQACPRCVPNLLGSFDRIVIA
jgi:1,4-alpha-glucan branching enzyme